jgi:hypothetical protein
MRGTSFLIGALILSVFIYSHSFAALSDSGTGISSVTIDNTKSNPVPVTGDVTLSGNPTVTIGDATSPVPIKGDVGITGTPAVSVGNTTSNPVPVAVVRKTVQLLGMTQFTVPQNESLEIGKSIDVSNCSEVRFSSRSLTPPSKYPIYCRLYDGLTGTLLAEGSSTFENSQTLLVQTPTSSSLDVKCINYDSLPTEIKAALYCR